MKSAQDYLAEKLQQAESSIEFYKMRGAWIERQWIKCLKELNKTNVQIEELIADGIRNNYLTY